jgi:glutamate-1-semialdehyde 2,1-aminomutase
MNWEYLEYDKKIFQRELATFVPERIFDAHAHLYSVSNFGNHPPPACSDGPGLVGFDVYQEHISSLFPHRKVSGLFFGFPSDHVNFVEANQFVATEARRDSHSRGQMLVQPAMDPEFIRETVRSEGFIGLKCYHTFSSEAPSFNARIPSYLPEEQVMVANEEGLTITLHIVRERALADPLNQTDIRRYAERYPNAQFILAHAARGFNPYHTIAGIHALKGLNNVWFDTSAVTDGGAFEAIIRCFGVERLLYGSDFPISHFRGRCVALGDSFLWLSADNTNFKTMYGEVQPTLVGIESLRVLKLACMNLSLSSSEIDAIFYENAAQLFQLDRMRVS